MVEHDVEVERGGGVDEQTLGAEGLHVGAVGVGEGDVASPDADQSGSQEDEGEPAERGEDVDAFARGDVWVVVVQQQRRR